MIFFLRVWVECALYLCRKYYGVKNLVAVCIYLKVEDNCVANALSYNILNNILGKDFSLVELNCEVLILHIALLLAVLVLFTVCAVDVDNNGFILCNNTLDSLFDGGLCGNKSYKSVLKALDEAIRAYPEISGLFTTEVRTTGEAELLALLVCRNASVIDNYYVVFSDCAVRSKYLRSLFILIGGESAYNIVDYRVSVDVGLKLDGELSVICLGIGNILR